MSSILAHRPQRCDIGESATEPRAGHYGLAVNRSLLTGLVLGVLLALGACSSAQESVRDSSGAIAEANDKASVFDMKVGDCHVDPNLSEESEEIETLPAVPCSQEHDYEVFATDTLDDGTFPGDAALEDLAMDFCEAEFEPFAGVSYEESMLDYTFFAPTEGSWSEAGDREITCVIGDVEARTTGSLKNAGR